MTVIKHLQYFEPFFGWFSLSLGGGAHGFQYRCHYSIWARARSSWIQTAAVFVLWLLRFTRCSYQSCFSSKSSSDHQMFSVCSLESFETVETDSCRRFEGFLWLVLSFSTMMSGHVVWKPHFAAYDWKFVGWISMHWSIWRLCCWISISRLLSESLRVAHNHCCSQAWCEGPPFLFPFSLHILLPLFNLLSFLIYALCCACISNISIS